MKFVPQLFGLQAARYLRHLLAGDAGIGGDERLRAHRWRAPAEVPVPVHRGQVSQRLLVTGRLLHELLCCREMRVDREINRKYENDFHFISVIVTATTLLQRNRKSENLNVVYLSNMFFGFKYYKQLFLVLFPLML